MTLAEKFHQLFLGLERAHGNYDLSNPIADARGKLKGKAWTKNEPLTVELWDRHLSGGIGLGVVPIREDSTCIWGCIDVDEYPLDLAAVEQKVTIAELPLVVCRSKSGGAAVFLFTQTPVSASLMRSKLTEFAKSMGYGKHEIFPKQDKITSDSDFGSWVNMPYHQSTMSPRYCILQGRAISAERFIEWANVCKVDELTLKRLESKIPVGLVADFSDAPPCLEYLTENGFPEGSRNNALFSMGVYARNKFPDEWEDKVNEYNQLFMGPGSFSEVQGIVRSLQKKGYKYKCTDQPLINHCDRKECYRRDHGMPKPGRPTHHDKNNGPCILEEVDRPIKVYRPPEGSGDEPQWTFTLGSKSLEVNLDMVMDQSRFLREYTKRFERILMLVPAPKWIAAMNELLTEAEEHNLPIDAGPEGQLMLHLEAFCNGKSHARDKSELLTGKPWTDEDGLTWFRSKDFMKYLDQNHFREFKQKELYKIFRRHGGKHDTPMLKGRCVAVWAIPQFAKQNEDFEEPHIPTTGDDAPF